ncbi:hypothetical protein PRBEI_2001436600 [Prionailurus iriomotensis]
MSPPYKDPFQKVVWVQLTKVKVRGVLRIETGDMHKPPSSVSSPPCSGRLSEMLTSSGKQFRTSCEKPSAASRCPLDDGQTLSCGVLLSPASTSRAYRQLGLSIRQQGLTTGTYGLKRGPLAEHPPTIHPKRTEYGPSQGREWDPPQLLRKASGGTNIDSD